MNDAVTLHRPDVQMICIEPNKPYCAVCLIPITAAPWLAGSIALRTSNMLYQTWPASGTTLAGASAEGV